MAGNQTYTGRGPTARAWRPRLPFRTLARAQEGNKEGSGGRVNRRRKEPQRQAERLLCHLVRVTPPSLYRNADKPVRQPLPGPLPSGRHIVYAGAGLDGKPELVQTRLYGRKAAGPRVRERRGGAGLEQALLVGEENSPVHRSSEVWILTPGQLLTCCVTLPKSLKLPRTQ